MGSAKFSKGSQLLLEPLKPRRRLERNTRPNFSDFYIKVKLICPLERHNNMATNPTLFFLCASGLMLPSWGTQPNEAEPVARKVSPYQSPARPEAIPQMTTSTECEFNGTWTWVCRDGYTLAASDNGKLHFYRLGRDDHSAHISHAFMRR
jgi:hypothetical protein